MTKIHYRVVPHDGGWAYTLDGAFSESYGDHTSALAAARRAAAEQHAPGETTRIEYQDETGAWHEELSLAGDRPDADVEN